MAKYHLYIRAIPGYLGYYATVDGDILKWGTQSQNMKQMVNEGRQRKSKIINYKSEVLTLHSQGFSIPEIIKSVGISKTSVHRIIKGKL